MKEQTKKIVFGIAFGQVISFFVTGTGVFSTYLADSFEVNVPVAQSFFNYFLLSFFSLYLHFKRDEWTKTLQEWYGFYLLLAFADVEANFLVVKAYQFTTITSIMLLDCFTIPSTMFLSYVFLGARYHLVQYIGVSVCVLGLCLLVVADYLLAKEDPSQDDDSDISSLDVVLGDGLVLMGAALYAISNVAQERTVKQRSRIEYLSFLGFFGTFISGFQMALLEHNSLASIEWSLPLVGCAAGFASCLFGIYVMSPSMMFYSSAVVFNLSLLTSDFYAAVVAVFLFDQKFSFLYVGAFSCTILGILIYHLPFKTPCPCDTKRDIEVVGDELEVDELN